MYVVLCPIKKSISEVEKSDQNQDRIVLREKLSSKLLSNFIETLSRKVESISSPELEDDNQFVFELL